MRARFSLDLVLVAIVAGCAAAPGPLPTTSARETASPTGPASVPPHPTDDAWHLVGSGNPATATAMTSVAVADRGFVGVGSSGGAGEIPKAWSTDDGVTWTPEDMSSRGTSPRTVLRWGDRFLAIGGGSSNRCAHPGELDTWVRRPDGAWLEAPFDSAFCTSGLTPLVQGKHAWLIGNGFGEVPTALESGDGLSWTDRSKALGDLQILAAATDGTNLWISGRAGATGTPDVRTSSDGRTWTSVALPPEGFSDAPALVTIGNRVDLIGGTGGDLQLYTPSDDTWQRRPIGGLIGLDFQSRTAGDGIVAIVSRDDGSSALAVSADGATWRSIPVPSEAGPSPALSDVAVGHDQIVLVGQIPPPNENETAVGGIWTAPASILEP